MKSYETYDDCESDFPVWPCCPVLQVEFEDMEDEDDWDCSGGARILGISYSPDREEASYAALISPEGEVVDYVKLSFLLCSRLAPS